MAIKFTEDKATDLRFPYGDFREIDGNFGPQFMYTVEGGGRSDRLFASPDLHRAIQNAGLAPGSKLRITATRGERRRRVWLVTPAQKKPKKVEALASDEAVCEAAPPEEDLTRRLDRKAANGNGHHKETSDEAEAPETPVAQEAGANGALEAALPKELEQMGRLMGLCLHASAMAWKHVVHGRQSPGDVRAVAITLFLECSRRGVTPEELLQDVPF